MENLRDYVNELKLRASYGEVGNQNGIGRYDGIQLYNYKSVSYTHLDVYKRQPSSLTVVQVLTGKPCWAVARVWNVSE